MIGPRGQYVQPHVEMEQKSDHVHAKVVLLVQDFVKEMPQRLHLVKMHLVQVIVTLLILIFASINLLRF